MEADYWWYIPLSVRPFIIWPVRPRARNLIKTIAKAKVCQAGRVNVSRSGKSRSALRSDGFAAKTWKKRVKKRKNAFLVSFLFWLENIETILQFSFLLVAPRAPVYFVLFRLKQNFRSCQFLVVIRCCAQARVMISSQIFSWSARPNSVNKSMLCLHYCRCQPSRYTVYLTPRCFQEFIIIKIERKRMHQSKRQKS